MYSRTDGNIRNTLEHRKFELVKFCYTMIGLSNVSSCIIHSAQRSVVNKLLLALDLVCWITGLAFIGRAFVKLHCTFLSAGLQASHLLLSRFEAWPSFSIANLQTGSGVSIQELLIYSLQISNHLFLKLAKMAVKSTVH